MSNIVEYAANICKRKKINREHLPPYLFEKQEPPPQAEEPPAEVVKKELVPPPSADEDRADSNGESWGEIERQMVVDALKEHGGNRNKAAEELGWGRMKLWRKMKKYKLL